MRSFSIGEARAPGPIGPSRTPTAPPAACTQKRMPPLQSATMQLTKILLQPERFVGNLVMTAPISLENSLMIFLRLAFAVTLTTLAVTSLSAPGPATFEINLMRPLNFPMR